ncbi:G-protein coupled receptor family C group 5 member C-like isoform X2 [Cololabis saira]|uniref:G-protein coupled receptor family C group 5 member C-like isoform X2 n=1 Tax=Cololabis saira TaxID=129043 RepID=UPI002AD3BD3D|nr:G-protein coupled receptor family C group 5 member C-like isoform X2 [Cololabis saira]
MATNAIVMATNATAPKGCGSKVDSLYYNLCDSGAVWGIAVEAAAGAGVVFCFVLFVMLLANLPLTKNHDQKSSAVLHAAFLLCTAGLFGLAFAFIVGKDFSTCSARRFLFGVLFAGCFSCLLVQAVRLNVLVRRSDDSAAPRIWPFCLVALALWLVEVVINVEWLIITVVRHPQGPPNASADTSRATATPCNVANQDFVMALIYVMALMLAALAASLAVLAGRSGRWKKEGGLILLASLLSVGVWVAWIVMYVYGNERTGGPAWDDPTLAIALAANAWLFLVSYTIPNVCCLSGGGAEDQLAYEQNLYAGRGVGYETILKQQSQTNLYVENKAFSMDEPNQGSKPVSPYSGYTGQLRSSVYQPTELALISKAVGNHQPERSYDMIIPRASTGSAGPPGGPGTGTGEAGNSAQTHGHGLQRTPQW